MTNSGPSPAWGLPPDGGGFTHGVPSGQSATTRKLQPTLEGMLFKHDPIAQFAVALTGWLPVEWCHRDYPGSNPGRLGPKWHMCGNGSVTSVGTLGCAGMKVMMNLEVPPLQIWICYTTMQDSFL